MHSSLLTIALALAAPLLSSAQPLPESGSDALSPRSHQGRAHGHALRRSAHSVHHVSHSHRRHHARSKGEIAAGQHFKRTVRRVKRTDCDADSDDEDDSGSDQTGSDASGSSSTSDSTGSTSSDPSDSSSLTAVSNSTSTDATGSDGSDGTCTEGVWQCNGSTLTRCDNSTWVTIANCTGENLVCSDDPAETGCIWAADISNSTSFAVNSSSAVSTSSTTSDDSDDGDDGEDCEEGEFTTSWTASSTPTAAATATADAQSASAASSAAITAAPSASQSNIGGDLLAQGSNSKSSSSSSSRKGHHSSSSSNTWTASSQDWDASSTQDWDAPSASASASSSWDNGNWNGNGNGNNNGNGNDDDSDDSGNSWSNSATSTSTKGSKAHKTSSGSVASASASASSGSGGSSNGGGNSGGSPGNWQAPHYVIYADDWLNSMPSASDLGSYNRFILAFWLSEGGAADDAQMWEQLDEGTRQSVLSEYHAAGIALMVSAFGSTEQPTTNGADATQTAQNLAAWVKKYGLDGVDIDYEDDNAMNNGGAVQWLVEFQNALSSALGDGYLISHAPQAPWFYTGYPQKAYVGVHEQVGNSIDFYNVQFYNQGSNAYTDCDSLINNSGSDFPNTALMQINSNGGVPLNKIVLGKPNSASAADNGYMSATSLAQCVSQAQSQGWNGGVMYWEWESNQGSGLIGSLLAAL